jgi:hypothetical protein
MARVTCSSLLAIQTANLASARFAFPFTLIRTDTLVLVFIFVFVFISICFGAPAQLAP